MYGKLFLTAAALAFGAQAMTADTMTLGFSESKSVTSAPIGVGFGDNMEIETAFLMPESTVNLLAGKTITGINGWIASTASVQTVYIFIRSELEGENLAYFKLVPNQLNQVKKGINKLKFSTPFTIPADNKGGLYIGFGYIYDDGNARPLAALSYGLPGAFFIRKADGKWYDHSDRGTACVEAVIEGEDLPEHNLRISRVDTPETLVMTDGKISPEFYIHNFGSKSVSAFDLVASVDGKEIERKRIETKIDPNAMLKTPVTFTPGMGAAGDVNIVYSIENLAEGDDADPADNSGTGAFEAVEKDYKHYILSEEFTTEDCGNCPAVIKMLHELLELPENDDIIQVAHHSGYKTDYLTTDFHQTYTSLYGGGTFAPGLCVDRILRGPYEQVFFPEEKSMITDSWNMARKLPALYSVNIAADYADDDQNKLTVKVTGETSTMHRDDNPSVTVWLCENDVLPVNQANGGKDFKHNHVTRACGSVNVWGDPVTFNGDEYEYSCTIDLDDRWNRDNMYIVAFIGENGEKWNKHKVKNAASLDFSKIGDTAVGGVQASADIVSVEYFDLAGRRVVAPEAGIVLRKTVYRDGSAKTVKIAK